MKKALSVCAVIAAVFVFAGGIAVRAETNSTSTASSTLKSKLEQKKGNVQQKAEQAKENLQEKLEQRKVKIKEIIASKVDHRLKVMVNNLEQFAGRVESRISKLADQGIDVSAAKTKLNSAKARIEEAKTALANLEKDVLAASQAQDPKKALIAVKTKISKGVVEKIKLAHRALVESVSALKQGANKAKETRATSTAPAATSSTSTSQ